MAPSFLVGISALVFLDFCIYHEEIHRLVKKLKTGKEFLRSENGADGEEG